MKVKCPNKKCYHRDRLGYCQAKEVILKTTNEDPFTALVCKTETESTSPVNKPVKSS